MFIGEPIGQALIAKVPLIPAALPPHTLPPKLTAGALPFDHATFPLKFTDLSLIAPLLRAIAQQQYTEPTPIQQKSVPHVLAGRDLLGCAQTGTGKSAAFCLPILQNLFQQHPPPSTGRRPIRCLVLTPTRELALQIGESFAAYGAFLPLTHTVIVGGVGQNPQEQALNRGVDIVVACPGRLLDLMQQGLVDLRSLVVFVLDEADRMLDMGFIHDIRKVVARLTTRRQTLFFSATMPQDIRELASTLLTNPAYVEVAPVSSTAERIEQSVYLLHSAHKTALLLHLMQSPAWAKVLIFTRTKSNANKLSKALTAHGIPSAAIHGNKSQNARVEALESFRDGGVRVLVASRHRRARHRHRRHHAGGELPRAQHLRDLRAPHRTHGPRGQGRGGRHLLRRRRRRARLPARHRTPHRQEGARGQRTPLRGSAQARDDRGAEGAV